MEVATLSHRPLSTDFLALVSESQGWGRFFPNVLGKDRFHQGAPRRHKLQRTSGKQ